MITAFFILCAAVIALGAAFLLILRRALKPVMPLVRLPAEPREDADAKVARWAAEAAAEREQSSLAQAVLREKFRDWDAELDKILKDGDHRG